LIQELRQIDQGEIPSNANLTRRTTQFALETASDQSHLKTEVLLLQRKYERLAAKERRMQVGRWLATEIHEKHEKQNGGV